MQRQAVLKGNRGLSPITRVSEIDLAKVGAGVTAIRRRTQRGLKLGPQLELIEGDVVVLIGTAAAVTAGEDVLLRGKQR
jgi:hypothetical protein